MLDKKRTGCADGFWLSARCWAWQVKQTFASCAGDNTGSCVSWILWQLTQLTSLRSCSLPVHCMPTSLLWQLVQTAFCSSIVERALSPKLMIGAWVLDVISRAVCSAAGPWQLSHWRYANGAFGSTFWPCGVRNSCCMRSSLWQVRQVSPPSSLNLCDLSAFAGSVVFLSAAPKCIGNIKPHTIVKITNSARNHETVCSRFFFRGNAVQSLFALLII